MDTPGQPLLSTGGVLLSATLTTILYSPPTAPSNVAVLLEQITLVNTTGVAQAWTLYRVPSGGAASDANAIGKTVPIAANKTFVVSGRWWLQSGWTLQGGAGNANTVNVQFDGAVIQ